MDRYAELMQRLLEIQSGGRERSSELISEDQRLMDGLQQKASVKSITELAASEPSTIPAKPLRPGAPGSRPLSECSVA